MAVDLSVTDTRTRPCAPSFHAAVRLARHVYHVKERLRCCAKRYKTDNKLFSRSLQKQARNDLNNGSDAGLLERSSERRSPTKREEINKPHLWKLGHIVSVVAGDQPLIACNTRHVTLRRSVDELRYTYDSTTLLLTNVASLSTGIARRSWPSKPWAFRHGRVDYHKFIANLVHTLKSLRQAALEALFYHRLKSLVENAQEWHQHFQGTQVDLGWFSEWPNGRRPLSTTWPWNIKPSLVVLWGVCWMFYDNSTRSAHDIRQQFQDEVASSWARQAPQSATANQQNISRWNEDTTWYGGVHDARESSHPNTRHHMTHTVTKWLKPVGTPEYPPTLPGYQSNLPTSYSPYIASYPVASAASILNAPLIWTQNQETHPPTVLPRNPGNSTPPTVSQGHRHSAPNSIRTVQSDYHIWQNTPVFQPRHSQQQPQRSVPTLQRSVPSGAVQPYEPFSPQPTLQGDQTAAVAFSPSLRLPVGQMQTYPSPHSDVSKDEIQSPSFSILPRNDISSNMMPIASPSTESRQSRPSVGRKSEEPPRNASGQITCDHPKCDRDPPVFSRRCEWTKHMDKHTRPYVCNLPGCEKIRGFTYSGGLSRHQREVHRQYGGPKASYMCPHKDCKRSTGSGFSRRENLQEHLRRVHRQIGDAEADKQVAAEAVSPVLAESRRRRRRVDDDEEDGETEPVLRELRKRRRNESDNEDQSEDQNQRRGLSAEVKRLRKELQEKDERLRKLEEAVQLLMKQMA